MLPKIPASPVVINAATLSEAINQLKDEMLRTLKQGCTTSQEKPNQKHAKKPWYDVELLLQRKIV